MIPVFFAEPDKISEELIVLGTNESTHAARVLRMKAGEQVMVVDGLGSAFRGEIVKCTGRSPVQIRPHSQVRNWGEPNVRLTLAAVLSAAYKFDSVVQKGTELGVKRFAPLVSEKSKIKVEDPQRARKKVQRLEKVALAAIKQCRRSYRPEITVPEGLSSFLGRTDQEACNLVFHPSPKGIPFSELDFSEPPKRITALVGPEAGFSEDEFSVALEAGYTAVNLGGRILRTETAGPVVCALLMNALGELR